MQNLRKQLIRLAKKDPEKREHIKSYLERASGKTSPRKRASGQDARDEYVERLREIEREMEKLRRRIKALKSEIRPDWGHVGDLGHVLDMLREMNSFLGR